MKPWIRRTAFKIPAFFFLFLFLCTTLAGGISIILMADAGIYTEPKGKVQADFYTSQMQSDLYQIMDAYLYDYTHDYYDNNNLRYSLYDTKKGTLLDSTYNNESCIATAVLCYYWDPFSRSYSVEHYRAQDRTPTYIIEGYLLEGLPYQDTYRIQMQWIDFFYEFRWSLIGITAASFVLSLFLLILLLVGAGRRHTDDEIHLTFWDRIPYDLLLAGFVLMIILEIDWINTLSNDWFLPLAILTVLLAIPLLFTTVVRLKAGSLFHNTLCRRLLQILRTLLRYIGHGCKSIFRNLPMLWQVCVGLACLLLFEFFFVLMIAFEILEPIDLIVLWILEKIPLTAGILYITLQMRRLQKDAAQIASGDLHHQIDTHFLIGPFKKHGEDLNHIQSGMQTAVETQLRSERMKTELITNVSHDIKTPLTSIINYVDLLKKEELPSDTTREYVDVLDRQSTRLKKLVEDLVAASKASTGNLAVNLEPCEVGILLEQAAAEYEDRFHNANLEMILTTSEAPSVILADGKHLWRVFDNLLSNITKYALPGTRVYLNLVKEEHHAVLTFRNISSSQLNITAEDLMERFVRGDSSRNTEGSGLGLSIARSLTELQHGSLDLTIDGDLFKVTLTFPLMEK